MTTMMIQQHSSAEFTVTFNGTTIETTVTSNPIDVNAWIYDVNLWYGSIQHNRSVVVGFRIEPGILFDRRVALLQLCINGECLICRLSQTDPIPAWLSSFLENENFIFVGLEMESQIMRLKADYPEQNVSRWMDLGSLLENSDPLMFECITSMAAGELCVENIAVRMMNIVEHFGFRPPNLFSQLNGVTQLSIDQVMWACVYAYVPFKVGTMLRAGHY